MKDYEKYGIPGDIWSEELTPPDYAIIYQFTDEDPLAIDTGSAELENRGYALWVTLEYWTTLEVSLLFAGLDPHSCDLYAISCKRIRDRDGLIVSTHYSWINEIYFAAAEDYLWIFERSSLIPKAPPIKWIKYFQKQISGKSIQHEFIDHYAEKWITYFCAELREDSQSPIEIISPEDSLGRREQQLEVILAVITALNYDPN